MRFVKATEIYTRLIPDAEEHLIICTLQKITYFKICTKPFFCCSQYACMVVDGLGRDYRLSFTVAWGEVATVLAIGITVCVHVREWYN